VARADSRLARPPHRVRDRLFCPALGYRKHLK